MVEQVIRFLTSDGLEFSTETEAKAHETQQHRIADAVEIVDRIYPPSKIRDTEIVNFLLDMWQTDDKTVARARTLFDGLGYAHGFFKPKRARP